MRLAAIARHDKDVRYSNDRFEYFVGLAALSLRARFKPRARAGAPAIADREASDSPPDGGIGSGFRMVMAALWVAALLFIVGYAVVMGESAMAQLDELDLVATYSLSP